MSTRQLHRETPNADQLLGGFAQPQHVEPTTNNRPDAGPLHNPAWQGTGNGTTGAGADAVRHWADDGPAVSPSAAHQRQAAAARPPQPTPRQRFDTAYNAQRDRPLDEDRRNISRWHELSPEERLAAANQDPRTAAHAGENGYTTTVNGHMYRYDQMPFDPEHPTLTKDLLGPNATQFNSRAFVTDRPRQNPADPKEHAYQDVTVLNNNGTTSTLNENDSGRVELPTSGAGYNTYHRNDVNLPNGTPQKDQWGTPSAIANAINIANDYNTLTNNTIEYGDIGTDDAKSPLLSTGSRARHASHGSGDQIDLRYPSTMYDTNSFIRSAEAWGANHYYYSPGMANTAFFSSTSDATTLESHRDHLHMGFGNGGD